MQLDGRAWACRVRGMTTPTLRAMRVAVRRMLFAVAALALVPACAGQVAPDAPPLTLPEVFCQSREICPATSWVASASARLSVPADASYDACVSQLDYLADYMPVDQIPVAIAALESDPCDPHAPGSMVGQ